MGNAVKKLAILGSTGSIGQQTLDIVRNFRDSFQVIGLACSNSIDSFTAQLKEFSPAFAHIDAKAQLPGNVKMLSMEDMASHPDVDVVVIATTGRAGLAPALAAIKSGKTVAVANKEILVMAGALITSMAAESGARILPIDSEHSAIWQCLRGEEADISRLLLTASGGPFFGLSRRKLSKVTVKDALNHPTWKMGKKVTIDSATLFNKGLEAIEARWLFNIPYEKIEIIIHRQSVVHSMIEFTDGSIKAQLSTPDMHLPIQYALFHPQRVHNGKIEHVDFSRTQTFSFEPVNYADFPCLKLALAAANQSGSYPAVLCAADEIAVEMFLNNSIGFLDIARIIEKTLDMHQPVANPGIEDILAADAWARKTALKVARKEF
ncbi:MAG: 1-deoxy-D-xylulose-5-phosphate reductoisomerase [Dehalococcoidia bacterium]|jgi:1-deoxy-D-xylulose-5-phosphate reductoisomerase